MVYVNIEDGTKELSIYDAMQSVLPEVHTICLGSPASMGSFVLVGGEITKSLASDRPETFFLFSFFPFFLFSFFCFLLSLALN
ncbi:hypothetical protein AMTRI_Chr01g135590 [Amborella trichopoda]